MACQGETESCLGGGRNSLAGRGDIMHACARAREAKASPAGRKPRPWRGLVGDCGPRVRKRGGSLNCIPPPTPIPRCHGPTPGAGGPGLRGERPSQRWRNIISTLASPCIARVCHCTTRRTHRPAANASHSHEAMPYHTRQREFFYFPISRGCNRTRSHDRRGNMEDSWIICNADSMRKMVRDHCNLWSQPLSLFCWIGPKTSAPVAAYMPKPTPTARNARAV